MDRWLGKVAVVTGASSGIGAAIVVDLLKAGVIVVGLARRVARVEELRAKVPTNVTSALHVFKCDVSVEEEVVAAFEWVKRTLGGVDILVNNAGIMREGNLTDRGNTDWVRQTLDTNVLGLVLCTREAFQSMRERNFDGHVVLINSVSGHHIPYLKNLGSLNIYPPTKYAVTALTEILRQEFNNAETKIKITSISPGLVKTEILTEPLKIMPVPFLDPEDISSAVLFAIGTPPHVQIHELTIKPVGEVF